MSLSVARGVEKLSDFAWNWPSTPLPLFIALLLGTGLYLTLRLRFIALRRTAHAVRIVRGDYDLEGEPGEITHFQALAAALSGTVGVGNIAGVATALHYGGPGALFWMWVTAVVGMSTKFAECTFAARFRVKQADGSWSGGPMHTIERGLGTRFRPLAVAFALAFALTAAVSGNATQAHTIADAARTAFRLPVWLSGGVSAALVAMVVLGGIRRIAKVASRVVPLMTGIYLCAVITILALHAQHVAGAFISIFRHAFQPASAVGGFGGAGVMAALNWGVRRGILSNEAGQGSAPIAHAAARTSEPVREGYVAMLEPLIDTLFICTLTGLVLLTTGVWHQRVETDVEFEVVRWVHGDCAESDVARCRSVSGRVPVAKGRVGGAWPIHNDSLDDSAQVLVDGIPATGFLHVQDGRAAAVVNEAGRAQPAKLRGRFLRNGEPMTALAFRKGLAPITPHGHLLVAISIFLFAFSTSVSWAYYGEQCMQYLLGPRSVVPYRLFYIAAHFLGAQFALRAVWSFSDLTMALAAIPNLLSLLLLSGSLSKLVARYENRQYPSNQV